MTQHAHGNRTSPEGKLQGEAELIILFANSNAHFIILAAMQKGIDSLGATPETRWALTGEAVKEENKRKYRNRTECHVPKAPLVGRRLQPTWPSWWRGA